MTLTNERIPPRLLFTFAVIADTHINADDHGSISPWECNKKANARARWVVAELNRLDPEFVIHLGDFVHPLPSLATFSDTVTQFKSLFEPLNPPLHLVPGNHDVGDKRVAWTPAEAINEEFLAQYHNYFGRDYFHFEIHDIHFLVINAPLINSGLPAEQEQAEWLEENLERYDQRRIFVFTHYPPFITRENEASHYDNIDEPGRSWLLKLLDQYCVEGVFAGHVHNIFVNSSGNSIHYALPSTAFVRHDYSELLRVEPGNEYGRNDTAKLGFVLVDVFDDRHSVRLIRSNGSELGPDCIKTEQKHSLSFPGIGSHESSNLLMDTRFDWSEIFSLPYNGTLDEFVRKEARNDYPLLALTEMGFRTLRIPAGDLLQDTKRQRIRCLGALGFKFNVFFVGHPSDEELDVLAGFSNLIASVELIMPAQELPSDSTLSLIKGKIDSLIYISVIRTPENIPGTRDTVYFHLVSHGFTADEIGYAREWLDQLPQGQIDGLVFRIIDKTNIFGALKALDELGQREKKKILTHIQFGGMNPAKNLSADFDVTRIAAEAVLASFLFKNVQICLDTFQDVDRGYFPRSGLVDRRFNPTLAGYTLASLTSIMLDSGNVSEIDIHRDTEGMIASVEWPGAGMIAAFPNESLRYSAITTSLPEEAVSGSIRLVDLSSGTVLGSALEKKAAINLLPRKLRKPVALQFHYDT